MTAAQRRVKAMERKAKELQGFTFGMSYNGGPVIVKMGPLAGEYATPADLYRLDADAHIVSMQIVGGEN